MKKNISLVLSIFLIITLIFYNSLIILEKWYEKKLVKIYFEEPNIKEEISQSNDMTIINNNYMGILKIPSIDLEKGFYSIDDKKNNVNKNIQILKNSTMPNQDNSILVIAGHTGKGKNAYFNDIDKLQKMDQAYIYYNNIKYIYEVIKIYETDKNGYLSVNENYKDILVLTTCSRHKNKQLVVICKLIKESFV